MKAGRNLLRIWLLCAAMLPAVAHAQLSYTNNGDGTATIMGYTGGSSAVVIPDTTNGLTVISIGPGAFNNIQTLISVTIPSSVTSYGSSAFFNCTNLLAVYFQGNSPTDNYPVGLSVFWRTPRATLYYVSGTSGWRTTFDGLPEVQWNPQVLTQLIYTNIGGQIVITGYAGPGGVVVIPNTINGTAVTGIGSNAFFNCTSLTGITIPITVTNIGDFAFANCTVLASITNPNSVTGIGVFSNCTALTNVIIPKTVTSIGDSEFSDCTALTSVTIGSSVTNIGDWAFQDCYSLNGVFFQGNAPVADMTVYNGDSNVTNYYLPKTTGWGSTFAGRPTVPVLFTYTNINGAVTITKYIGTGGAVVIPDSINDLPVTGIGVNAFEGSHLTSVIIPNSVTTIGVQAFSYCYSLTNVTIGNSVTTIGNRAFYACYSLNTMSIPNSVTLIREATFAECTSLTSVTIGDGVTSIEDLAFDYCYSLTTVTIGSGVTSIGSYALYDCTNLTGIYFRGNAPNVSSRHVFDYDTNATAYYLPGTTGWGDFNTNTGIPTALWFMPNPQILNNDPSFGAHTNGFGFTIFWATNVDIVVEACTDLSNSAWTPLGTNTLTDGSSYFSDSQWTNYPGRYYRIRTP